MPLISIESLEANATLSPNVTYFIKAPGLTLTLPLNIASDCYFGFINMSGSNDSIVIQNNGHFIEGVLDSLLIDRLNVQFSMHYKASMNNLDIKYIE